MSEEAERVFLTNMIKARESDFAFRFSYPNKEFDIPKNAPYGEFHIVLGPKPVTKAGEGKGKVRNEYQGFVQMNVWLPKDSGTKAGTLAKDLFKSIYQMKVGRDSACAIYEFGVMQSFAPSTKVGWEVVSFRVPYTRSIVEVVQVSL